MKINGIVKYKGSDLDPVFEVEVTTYDSGEKGSYFEPPIEPEIEFDILGWNKDIFTSPENSVIKKSVEDMEAHESIMNDVFDHYEKWLNDCQESAAISNYEN